MLNEPKIRFASRDSVSKSLSYTVVKIYAVMSFKFKSILNVSCLSGDLEGKVKWLDNFQKLRHLQEIVVWPPLWDRDKRFFIPEVKVRFTRTECGTQPEHISLTKSPAARWNLEPSFMSTRHSLQPHGTVCMWGGWRPPAILGVVLLKTFSFFPIPVSVYWHF